MKEETVTENQWLMIIHFQNQQIELMKFLAIKYTYIEKLIIELSPQTVYPVVVL